MKILPLNTTSALQINPNLGIILTTDMMGWFYERYVNIFITGTTIDYVDNVNYAGLINVHRYYQYDEIISNGIIDTIEAELDHGCYMHAWVDEFHIPQSVRYHKYHFVHPLMVYGYDNTNRKIHCVFFNLDKGQMLIEICYQDFINAMTSLEQTYHCGGTEEAVKKTILACSLPEQIKGSFHIEVFAQQLSNYICCTMDNYMKWYTTSRSGVCDSEEVFYGIQVYLRLIHFLQSYESCRGIHYKTVHDFISHKKYLLDRFKYIQENYRVSNGYRGLVERFAQNCEVLEKLRLLNMKKQLKLGCMAASLCYEKGFLAKLINELTECYNTEMTILPQIYDHITKLSHSKTDKSNTMCLPFKLGSRSNDYLEYEVPNPVMYVTKLDIVRNGGCYSRPDFEYVLLNGSVKYYLEQDHSNHIPLRTVKFPAFLVNSIRIYTDSNKCDYTVFGYSLMRKTDIDSAYSIDLDMSWSGYHHVKQLSILPPNEITLQVVDEDPYIEKEHVCIDTDKYPYLHIRMRSTTKTIYAQVYFATIDNPYISMDKSLFYKIESDGNMHSYYINMRHNRLWKGVVQKIRLDPAQYHDNYPWSENAGGECTIERIEFLSQMPEGEVECMVADQLKDDGSTFLIG